MSFFNPVPPKIVVPDNVPEECRAVFMNGATLANAEMFKMNRQLRTSRYVMVGFAGALVVALGIIIFKVTRKTK